MYRNDLAQSLLFMHQEGWEREENIRGKLCIHTHDVTLYYRELKSLKHIHKCAIVRNIQASITKKLHKNLNTSDRIYKYGCVSKCFSYNVFRILSTLF